MEILEIELKLISRLLLLFFVKGSVVSVPFYVQLYVFQKKHVTEIFLKPRFPLIISYRVLIRCYEIKEET